MRTSEREHPLRGLDELGDVQVLALDLLDDAPDRLVDERDPELFVLGHTHRMAYGVRARQAIAPRPRAGRAQRAASARPPEATDAASAPTWTPAIDVRPSASAGFQRMFPYDDCRQVPAATVGRIAASDVACASSCPRPRSTSVGTKEARRRRRTFRRRCPRRLQAAPRARASYEQPDRDRDEERREQERQLSSSHALLQSGAESGPESRRNAEERRVRVVDLARDRERNRSRERGDPDRRERRRGRGVRRVREQEDEQRRETSPPPTPRSALMKPARSPIATSFTRVPSPMDADELLERLREKPERAAVILDVDGVLAPIVDRPEDARVPTDARGASAPRRRVRARRLRERPHGRRCAPDRRPRRARLRRRARSRARPGSAALANTAPCVCRHRAWPVEDKGLTLSFHYRTAEARRLRSGTSSTRPNARVPQASSLGSAGWCSRCGRRSRRTRAPPCVSSSRSADSNGRSMRATTRPISMPSACSARSSGGSAWESSRTKRHAGSRRPPTSSWALPAARRAARSL